jgi:hypothetical protein
LREQEIQAPNDAYARYKRNINAPPTTEKITHD